MQLPDFGLTALLTPLIPESIFHGGIETANHAPIEKQFNPGVLQT